MIDERTTTMHTKPNLNTIRRPYLITVLVMVLATIVTYLNWQFVRNAIRRFDRGYIHDMRVVVFDRPKIKIIYVTTCIRLGSQICTSACI